MPYSPKATLVPPFAGPWRSGWCGLRKPFGGLRGMSMVSALLLRLSRCGRDRRTLASVPTGSASRGRPAGIRATSCRSGRTRPATTRSVRPVSPVPATPRRGSLDRGFPTWHGVTLVDPDLHADPAEGRTGLEEAVLDVGPQRVQRNPALAVELGAAHFRTTE